MVRRFRSIRFSPFRRLLPVLAIVGACATLPAAAQEDVQKIDALSNATILYVERQGADIVVLALRKNNGLFKIIIDAEGVAKTEGPLIASTGNSYIEHAVKSGDTLHLAGRVNNEEQAYDLLFNGADSLVFADTDTDPARTESLIYRFGIDGKNLATSFLGPQPGTMTFVLDNAGRYYVGNSEVDVISSFTTDDQKGLNSAVEYEAKLGILTGMQGVHSLALLGEDTKLLALNSIDGEARMIDLVTRRSQNQAISMLRQKEGWVNFTVSRKMPRIVATDTFRTFDGKKNVFDARLSILTYGLDPYTVREITSFDIGKLFFHDINVIEGIKDARQSQASIRAVFNETGDVFAIYSNVSTNAVLYRMEEAYIERINVITFPEYIRSASFAGDETLFVEGKNTSYLYRDVASWQPLNDAFWKSQKVRRVQRELAQFYASDPVVELPLVDGFAGEKTVETFALYAREYGVELPPDGLGTKKAKHATADLILASLQQQMASPDVQESLLVSDPESGAMIARSNGSFELDLTKIGVMRTHEEGLVLGGAKSNSWPACALSRNDHFIMELSFSSQEIDRMPVLCLSEKPEDDRRVQIDFYMPEASSKGVSVIRDPLAYRINCDTMRFVTNGKASILLDDAVGNEGKSLENDAHLRRAFAIQSGWASVNQSCFEGSIDLAEPNN